MEFRTLLCAVGIFLATSQLLTGCSSSKKSPSSDPISKQADTYIDLASQALSEGDIAEALTHADTAIERDPKRYEPYYLKALAYSQKDQPVPALEFAEIALKNSPQNNGVKNMVGRLLMEQGQLTRAERLLTEAAFDLKNPDSDVSKINLSQLHLKKNKPQDAKKILSEIADSASPQSCLAAYFRGKIYATGNAWELAKKDFESATKLNCSKLIEAHLSLSHALLKLNQKQEAILKLKEVESLFPHSSEAEQARHQLKSLQ